LLGDAYTKSAEIAEKQLKESFEAASDYVNAGKAYKNVSSKLAIQSYQLAINIQMESNKFSQAARLWKELGEMQEKEHETEAAQFSYQKAADCYEAEDSKAQASGCHVKVAELAQEQEDYKKAVEIYEKLANALADNKTSSYSVQDYLWKALLCNFILAAKSPKQDMTVMENTIEKYTELLPSLDGTRQLQLIKECVAAFTDDNVEDFTDAVFKYDEIYKLDNSTAKILLDVKKALKDGPQAAATNLDFTGADAPRDTDDFT
jgi:alpha-soluble NSF attachment protein